MEVNNAPKVSVLMPAYNAEKYIGEAIESILNQTFKDFEFIIIDDCSTDGTWGIIQDYAKKDGRIRAYRNKKNCKIPKNRNTLVVLSRADYIAWQDSDDISLPERIAEQYNVLCKNERIGICGGYLKFFNDENTVESIRKYEAADSLLRKKIFRYSPVAQPVAMIRKEVFNVVGAYDESLEVAQDLDISFKIGQKYEFTNIPKILLKYRVHNNSITFKKLRTQELNTIKIRLKYSNKYPYNVIDIIYNFFHFISIFAVPTKLKISIFNLVRNKKL